MRSTKLKVGAALLIFGAFVFAQIFLLHPRHNRQFKEWLLRAEERPPSDVPVKDDKKLQVACSNWKRVLMVLEGADTDSNNIGNLNHSDFTFLADLTPLAIKHRLKEYYKFMFVREPLERLTSAYKDKFVLNNTSFHKSYGIKIVKKVRKNPPRGLKGDDVTISEFFQYITESRMEDMNEHWMPYHMLCQPCAVSYDFIGSFENLESDATQVLKHLNIDQQVSFPKQQKWYKAGGKGFVIDAPKYTNVPKKLLKKIIDKYSNDYTIFSYSTPSVEIV
ncbi:carbohydrate sulfotransferase 14-like isoform X4 [Acropora muricata]|uniref:carbohydrate sulfotransferase 14-like isoform X4 n=1 Tax=Acropora muricata TaxID=159855 RepID=UPI0034E54694